MSFLSHASVKPPEGNAGCSESCPQVNTSAAKEVEVDSRERLEAFT